MLTISCPKCRTMLQVKEEHRGMQVRCPTCQQVMVVPRANATPVAATPAPSAQPPPSAPPTRPPTQAASPPSPPRVSPRDEPPARSAERQPGEKRFEDLPTGPLPENCPREADSLGQPLAT